MGRAGSMATGGALSMLPSAPGKLNSMPQLGRRMLSQQPQYGNLRPTPGKQGQSAKLRGNGSPMFNRMMSRAQEKRQVPVAQPQPIGGSGFQAAQNAQNSAVGDAVGKAVRDVMLQGSMNFSGGGFGGGSMVGIGPSANVGSYSPPMQAAAGKPESYSQKETGDWAIAALGGGKRHISSVPNYTDQPDPGRLPSVIQAESRLLGDMRSSVKYG